MRAVGELDCLRAQEGRFRSRVVDSSSVKVFGARPHAASSLGGRVKQYLHSKKVLPILALVF